MLSRSIIDSYLPLIHEFGRIGDASLDRLMIPKLKKSDILDLLSKCQEIFQNEKTLLRIEGDFNIVGDLHGNIRDLLRILAFGSLQMSIGYIFLGDYVDKGEFSIEVITLILSLKLAYPNKVFMIRGNHEFEDMNSEYGFKKQVLEEYDEDVFDTFIDCFGYIPLGAVANNRFILLHGGISPSMNTLEQIEKIERPIYTLSAEDPNIDILDGILWSDPGDTTHFTTNIRGRGYVYGGLALLTFLKQNNLEVMIRSHQCVDGFEDKYDNRLLTVFSTSCYSKNPVNSCGIAQIICNVDEVIKVRFPPNEQLSKRNTDYKIVEISQTIPLCQRKINTTFSKTISPNKKYAIKSKIERLRRSFIRN